MTKAKTVAQSVQEEVERHKRKILKLEEAAIRIAGDHNCPDHSLIRLALLHSSKRAQTLVKL